MAELIEALDEKGRPTGQRKTWLNIINDGDWRNVVHVWIVNPAEQLLIQQRALKGAWYKLWDVSMGGSVSAGEEPINTAVRELEEELGVKVSQNELKKLGIWNVRKNVPERDNKESREFSHTYLLNKGLKVKDLALQKEEVEQIKWKSFEDIRSEINDDFQYKKWVPHGREYYLEVMKLIEEQRK